MTGTAVVSDSAELTARMTSLTEARYWG